MGYSDALITGASTGIGKDLALALARQGASLTLLDIDLEGVKRTAAEVQQTTGVACAVERLDVTDSVAQDAAIKAHVARYGGLSLVVLNAGIAEQGDLFDPSITGWQRCHDVNVTAVLHGVRSAVFAMKSGGTIICVASAGGIFPMPVAPVYAAAKAGVVQFVRSIGPGLEKRKSIRVLALCPEFIDTPLVRRVMVEDPPTAKRMLGSLDIKLLPPAAVTRLALDLLADKTHKGGTAALLRQDGTVEYPFKNTLPGKGSPSTQPGSSQRSSSTDQAGLAAWAGAQHRPATYRKWQVHTLSPDFVKATRLVSAPCPHLVPAGQLLVRRVYAGINASDINFTSGRYFGSPRAAAARLPFDCGFEAVSVVAAVGEGVTGFSPGDVVASFTYDAFGEYGLLPTSQALAAPAPRPEVVALLTSGLTASIAFEQCGPLVAGQTVLVTAAAGGTGQFAVQLAKLAGCHVIATAGGPDKVALCKRLGADRVVDYKAETLKDVLKKEYPKGVDVVYESVGGDMFSAAVDGLADMGKLIVIGMMASYAEGWPVSQNPGLPEKLLWKSASMHGFFLTRHARHWRRHLSLLLDLWQSGRLQVMLDPVSFIGIESVPAAVAHLQSGKSIGKVVVQIAADLPQGAAPSRHTAHAKL